MNKTYTVKDFFAVLKKYRLMLIILPTFFAGVTYYKLAYKLPQFAYYATIKIGQFTNVNGDEVKSIQTKPLIAAFELRTFVLGMFSERAIRADRAYVVAVNEYTIDGAYGAVIAIRADSSEQAHALVTKVMDSLEEKYGVYLYQFQNEKKSLLVETEEVLTTNRKLRSSLSEFKSRQPNRTEDALTLIGRSLLNLELKKFDHEAANLRMALDAKYTFPFALLGFERTNNGPIYPKTTVLVLVVWLFSFALLFFLSIEWDRRRTSKGP